MSEKVHDAGPDVYNPSRENAPAWAWKTAYDSQAKTLSKAMAKIHEQAKQIEMLKEDIRKRDFMIENGLGWEDMISDCL